MARFPAVLRHALLLALPISAGLTAVLLPMALLYEQARRETQQTRLEAEVHAASLQVQQILREVEADSALAATLSSDAPNLGSSRPLRDLLAAQLREYPRYSAVLVINQVGQPVLQLSRHELAESPPQLLAGVARSLQLAPGRFCLSAAFLPAQPRVPGQKRGQPPLLAARSLFAGGQRRGALIYAVNLTAMARDFDQTTNRLPARQRGYLLDSRGQVLNPASRLATPSFALAYPSVWRQMQRQPIGTLHTSQGLFLYDGGYQQRGLVVVVHIPGGAAPKGSMLRQPLGWALLTGLYLLVAAGSLARAQSQQRLAQLRLQERQLAERLQAVLSSAAIGTGLCDPSSGNFTTVNPALCRLLQRGESELLGRSWLEFCHLDDRDSAAQLLQSLRHGDSGQQHLRLRWLRPDHSSVWGDLALAFSHGHGQSQSQSQSQSLTQDSARPEALILQITDVSELVEQAAYLEAAAEAGIVGVWDWDIQRDVLTWDPVMYKLYGRSRDQFAAAYEAWASAVHPDDRPFAEAEIEAAVKGWRPYQPRFRVVWPDGTIHHLQARSRTTYAADGRALRMIGVNYDITDQVQREQEIDAQRALLAATLDALVDPHLFLTLEPELRIAELNPAAASFFHHSPYQLVGSPLAQLLPPERNGPLLAALLAVADAGPPLIADEQPLHLASCSETPHVDLRAVAVRDGVALSFRDVSARRRASQELAASEQRFRLLAENVSDVVFLCEADRFVWIAPGLQAALGWRAEQWLNQPLGELCHPDDQEQLRSHLLQVEHGQSVRFRLRLSDSEARWRWLEIQAGPYRDADGSHQGLAGALRGVDDEVAAEQELNRRARTDTLTGLLNRREILERLEGLNQRRRQGDAGLAVLFCDIDHFKEINDQHGHGGDDAVLQVLAERLQRSIRGGDLVGRLGGDELLVVLQAMPSLAAAEALAWKIHGTAREPLPLPTGLVHPTLSIGVALIEAEESIEAVLNRADQAMYAAKQHGRNRVVTLTPSGLPTAGLPQK